MTRRKEVTTQKTKGGGYRYGKTGKTYYGKGAKAKADRQGRAGSQSPGRQRLVEGRGNSFGVNPA